ncbi:MAG: cysteine synthase A [Bacilli bacterium]|nr:cysteine synthase A [Bacilli bacterium]
MTDKTIADVIGNTPLVRLTNIEKEFGLNSKIYAKLERANPTGSIKDRAAAEMIKTALAEGRINSDTLIIEPTSGNTGIGLASVCTSLGLKLVLFMPSNCSIERVKMMRALGAECILVSEGGMAGCIEKVRALAKENPNSFIPMQFENEANVAAHYKGTGPEIYKELEGNIDVFVSAFGTGGTITGVTKFLKEKGVNVFSVGVEPAGSPFVSEGKKGPHKIQGIGAGFKPGILDLGLVDRVMTIGDEEAYEFARLLARKEGCFAGISSGANVAAAVKMAKENPGKTIVTVLPDNGERYLSVEGLYE